jgi:hypothetical protein
MARIMFLLLFLVSGMIDRIEAYWRVACSVVQTGRIDTVLDPGQVSGHVHKISGASSTHNRGRTSLPC